MSRLSSYILGSCLEPWRIDYFQFSFSRLLSGTLGVQSKVELSLLLTGTPPLWPCSPTGEPSCFSYPSSHFQRWSRWEGGERWVPDLEFCDRSAWDTLYSLCLVSWLWGQCLDVEESWQSCFSQKRSIRPFFSSGISTVVCSYHLHPFLLNRITHGCSQCELLFQLSSVPIWWMY